MRSAGQVFLVLAVLASLGVTSIAVVRRQAQALDLLDSLEDIRRGAALLEAERVRLSVQVKALESRSRVVAAARELGMQVPSVQDLVLLPWNPPDRTQEEDADRQHPDSEAQGRWWERFRRRRHQGVDAARSATGSGVYLGSRWRICSRASSNFTGVSR